MSADLELGGVDLDSVEPLRVVRPEDIADVPLDRRWLVEGIWPAGGVGVIAATPKVGKTWIAAELAVSVSTGLPFVGNFPVQQTGRVLMFASEDQGHEMKDRLRGLAGQRGVGLADLAFDLVDEPSLRLNHARELARFERRIRDDRPVLVILDPLRRVYTGNESSSDAMSLVLGQLRRIQRQYGVAIVLTHHVTKQSEFEPVSGNSMRGSGDIHAWGDANIYAWRDKGDQECVVLKVEHRNALARAPFTVRRVADVLPTGGTTAHLDYAGDAPTSGTGGAAPNKGPKLRERVLAKLAEGPIGTTKLRASLEVAAGELSKMCTQLCEDEKVIEMKARKWVLVSAPCPSRGAGAEGNGVDRTMHEST